MSISTIPNTYLIYKHITFKHWRRHVTYMNVTRHWLVLSFHWFTLCLFDAVANIAIITDHTVYCTTGIQKLNGVTAKLRDITRELYSYSFALKISNAYVIHHNKRLWIFSIYILLVLLLSNKIGGAIHDKDKNMLISLILEQINPVYFNENSNLRMALLILRSCDCAL
jgi:hypothetical protein